MIINGNSNDNNNNIIIIMRKMGEERRGRDTGKKSRTQICGKPNELYVFMCMCVCVCVCDTQSIPHSLLSKIYGIPSTLFVIITKA